MSEIVRQYYDQGVDTEWRRPGRYTLELGRRGFRATLVALSGEAVAFARQRPAPLGQRVESFHRADTRHLPVLATTSFDAALCMGPRYHLVETEDRRRAL